MHDEYILLAWGTPGQDVYEYDDAPHPVAQSITQFIHVRTIPAAIKVRRVSSTLCAIGVNSKTWTINA